MSGAEGWDDMEDWAREREAWLRRYLRLGNGIPGHDTIRRVFEALSPLALEEHFEEWMSATCPAVKDRVIAIDGKALRGSGRSARGLGLRALHQESAYAAEYGLTLEQRTCDEISNEIMAIEDLLPSLAVADNQPDLAKALHDFFSSLYAPWHCWRQVSLHETRRCIAVGELDWLELLDLKARWSKLTSVACIDSTCEIAGRVETEKRYMVSSLPAGSRRILHAVRTHWGIENGLHWCLDVTFG